MLNIYFRELDICFLVLETYEKKINENQMSLFGFLSNMVRKI